MSDIVERLIKHAAIESNELEDDLYAAAAEIERLRAALERIAAPGNWGDDGCWTGDSYPDEIARAALNPSRPSQPEAAGASSPQE